MKKINGMNISTSPRVLAAAALALSLAGCVSTDISDLEQWVQEVLARPGGIIDPLPPFKPYEAYAYKSAEAGARDPFVPFYASRSEEKAKVAGGSGLTKEQEWEMKDRSREELEQFELDSLRYVFDAVSSIRQALGGRVPLIGFAGSPWTLACYMVEGKGSDDYRAVKTLMYQRPDLMQRLQAAGRNPENVMVCFKETTWENWAFAGGRLIHT